MSTLIYDIRYACRALVASPGFAVVAVLSLALGIGATTSIFSVVGALLLRPLPYKNAARQVILWNTSPGLGITEDWFSTAQYFDIRNGQHSFSDVAIAIGANANLTDDGNPERIGTLRASSTLLPMLGAQPLFGSLFDKGDDQPGRSGKAILAHGTWIRRYGGDRNVLGRSLTLNGQPYTIIAVLSPSFSLPREVMPTLGVIDDAEVILPLPMAANAADVRNREDYNILATLAPGATLAQARAELDGLTARLRREHPDFYPPNGGLTFTVLPLQEQTVGGVRRALLVLMGAVGFVLLIACANVANLLLSRALGRQRELAVRAAIGATRLRLLRQLLTESGVLAVFGGTLGLAIAIGAVAGIRTLGAASVPRLHEITIEWRVLLFTCAISLGSGALVGILPAVRLSRIDLHGSLKSASRAIFPGAGAVWGRGNYLRRLLVVAELALSVVLLIGAGLLIRSFVHLQKVAPGFDPENVLTLELTMTGRKYNDAATILETYRQVFERLSRLPGVSAAGGVTALPLSNMMAWGPIVVEGRATPEGEKFLNADIRVVGGDYFRAMKIPLIKGRLFDVHDNRTAPRVVVIDEQMAAQLWPGTDPIGERIRTGGFDATPDTPWMTVVGIVGRVKQDALDADSRMAYYRFQEQTPSRAMNVVLRAAANPGALASAVTEQIRAVDPDLPIYKMRTMGERVNASLAERRFSTLLLTAFAAVAMGLAALGIYGVMAYVVSQGTRELGIRLALGAAPRDLLLLVVRQGMAVAFAGMILGLAGALALTRFMSAMLVGVGAWDPLTFAAIAGVLLLVSLAASVVPARRAARVAPATSLRSE